MYGKGYGMPSSHAQFTAFFSIYLTLFLLIRHSPHGSNTASPSPYAERLILSFLALAGAASVAASRIYLNYHTPRQVLIGCYAGAGLAVAWFIVTALIRSSGLLEWGIDTKLARMVRIRDLVVQEDLADAGWVKWEAEKRKRAAVDRKRL
jgi:dolichyldiphosphatase